MHVLVWVCISSFNFQQITFRHESADDDQNFFFQFSGKIFNDDISAKCFTDIIHEARLDSSCELFVIKCFVRMRIEGFKTSESKYAWQDF